MLTFNYLKNTEKCKYFKKCPQFSDSTHTHTMPYFFFSCPSNRYKINHARLFCFSSKIPTAPSRPTPSHYRDFAITLRHTTLDKTPLDEWSARRRDLCLTTHNNHTHRHPWPQRDSNPQYWNNLRCVNLEWRAKFKSLILMKHYVKVIT